ncbi:MAG: isoprenylcysteine carboxylmethyltransferase family protein [Paludibacter sp.]|nr:isoprenylcysteine carboxylmethyltransferase family protein [Paludibacter sp.]
MSKFIIFGIISFLIIIISWRTLFNPRSHGFFRFFSWICMAWLFANNYKYWFINPFTFNQILSWILLIYSAYLVIFGLLLIQKIGKPSSVRNEKNLFGFEKTTELIDTGVFKYIRHPLYASLILVTCALFLKNPEVILFLLSIISTTFLYFTSKYDEKECLHYFGDIYSDYMKRTKMFIPFIF